MTTDAKTHPEHNDMEVERGGEGDEKYGTQVQLSDESGDGQSCPSLWKVIFIFNSFHSNYNLLPPLPSYSPNPFDIPPLTHKLTWQGGFLPLCHAEKCELIQPGGFLPSCCIEKHGSKQQGGVRGTPVSLR